MIYDVTTVIFLSHYIVKNTSESKQVKRVANWYFPEERHGKVYKKRVILNTNTKYFTQRIPSIPIEGHIRYIMIKHLGRQNFANCG